jgi:hypothetical protein
VVTVKCAASPASPQLGISSLDGRRGNKEFFLSAAARRVPLAVAQEACAHKRFTSA